jgi:hypothetical protein
MRRFRFTLGCLASLTLLAAAARAEAPPDPLRLVPDQADFLFKIEDPGALTKTYSSLNLFKEFQKIDSFREAYDSTNFRRFYQLVAYFEKQMGHKWPELLDRLAGGGAALAVRIGDNPAPVLLVVQGKDEKLAGKFFSLARQVLDQELARQESKERLTQSAHRGMPTVHFGKQFHAALVGAALVMSNKPEALHRAIDLHIDGPEKSLARLPGIAEARKVLPPRPLAWAWLNLEKIKQSPQAKNLLAEKQNDALLTVAAGSLLDLARRSPFLCAGIYRETDRLRVTIRFPRGLDGMPAKFALSHPPADQRGSLPLLKPRNVLASSSSYFDVAQFWLQRKDLFNEKQVKTFEEFNKTSARILAGARFSDLLTQAGPYQRFVLVQPTKSGYKTQPAQLYPAGAFILSMRQPDKFSKSMDTLLRAAALLNGGQLNLKLVEEKKGRTTIVGYRFADERADRGPFRNDVNNSRFNFSPCFVRVGDQFVVSSTMELAAELVDLLEKEARETNPEADPVVNRTRLYAGGGAAVMRAFKDPLLTQTILGQAVSPEEAERQVQSLIDLVGRLGVVDIEQQFTKNSFHYDLCWKWGK